MLYNTWMSYAAGGVTTGVLLALAQIQVAAQVSDEGDTALAYIAAFLAIMESIMWLLQGASDFLYYGSVLREAEAD